MNRREFIKSIVATVALTTGLARTTLAAVSERVTVRGRGFYRTVLTAADLEGVEFSECNFIDCRLEGDLYLSDANLVEGHTHIAAGSAIHLTGSYNNVFSRPWPPEGV